MTTLLQFILSTCALFTVILSLLLASTGDITGAALTMILTAIVGVSIAFLDL